MAKESVRISICINCLAIGAAAYPVGPEKGTQRDPYHDTIDLCANCMAALGKGNMAEFHERFNANAEVRIKVRPE